MSGDAVRDEIALFWLAEGGTVRETGSWLQALVAIVEARDENLSKRARLFALAALAVADSVRVVCDTKARYFTWRPAIANREADLDGNEATEPRRTAHRPGERGDAAAAADDARALGAVWTEGRWYNARMLKRIVIAALFGLIASVSPDAQQRGAAPAMQVYKTPTCGCCSKWVDHMRHAGFTAEVTDMSHEELQALKTKLGVPQSVNSCHTARVGGYLVEGHIPADTVKRLLKEKPKVAGIAVPGMPLNSPGMEVPGRQGQPYDVLTFDKSGATRVYTTIKP